ncbi:MAG: hypothetical protein ABH849_03950 [Nanoarchaeota archaeon]
MPDIKSYVKSERLKYLALGLVAGFFIGLSQEPYRTWFIFIFVILAVIMGSWFWKKSKT